MAQGEQAPRWLPARAPLGRSALRAPALRSIFQPWSSPPGDGLVSVPMLLPAGAAAGARDNLDPKASISVRSGLSEVELGATARAPEIVELLGLPLTVPPVEIGHHQVGEPDR